MFMMFNFCSVKRPNNSTMRRSSNFNTNTSNTSSYFTVVIVATNNSKPLMLGYNYYYRIENNILHGCNVNVKVDVE